MTEQRSRFWLGTGAVLGPLALYYITVTLPDDIFRTLPIVAAASVCIMTAALLVGTLACWAYGLMPWRH